MHEHMNRSADIPAPAGGNGAGAPEGFDLLRVRPIRALVRWGGFPFVFQAVLLGCFVAFAVLAWGAIAPPGARANLFARTHLVTLVIWGVWWPAMVWVAVWFGRVWCMVCPLELVGNISERLGRRLGLPQRSLPGWVAGGSLVVALYAAIHLLVSGGHIDRVPAATAWFLVGLMGLAAATGLAFTDRAYCRGFCPVGLLLGIYGRGGMLAVRAANASTCRDCVAKECRSARYRDRLDARSCPSLLNPATLDNSKDCLLCGQCIKVCANGNMRLLLRRPFAAADVRAFLASWPVTLFVMLDSGFVVSEWF